MSKLFRKLWADDAGAIITVEWILFVGIVLIGLIPAFAGLRNLLTTAVIALGNSAYVIGTADWSYNGQQVNGTLNTANIVSYVNGAAVQYTEDPLTRTPVTPANSVNGTTVYLFATNIPAP